MWLDDLIADRTKQVESTIATVMWGRTLREFLQVTVSFSEAMCARLDSGPYDIT
jgi:hypothetical protein